MHIYVYITIKFTSMFALLFIFIAHQHNNSTLFFFVQSALEQSACTVYIQPSVSRSIW